jgi:predicted neuraminidase
LDEAPNGDIDVCFTYHRRAIAHLRIPADELKV